MDNVYNRSLFSKSNRPARQKLQKMGGIMSSSPELMEAAQKVGNTPNQNMGGAGSTKMANLGPPPMAMPMVPPMPMPMPSSVQMPTPPVKPMGYAPGGEVEVVDITKTPTSNLNRPEFLSSFEQYLGTTPLLANKLDEAFDSREEAAAEAAKTKDAIDAAIATENTDNIVNTVLDQAGMPLNDDSKKEFARSVFGMEDVNDIDEINKRIADVAIGSSIGKGPDAFAEAVILGLGEYKKTATARAAAKSGGKSGMSPLEPFADAVRDLAGKLVAARGVDIDTAMQQAAAALAPYYSAGGGVPVASSSGPSLDERRTLVEQALKQQPDKRELILDQAAKDGVNIEGLIMADNPYLDLDKPKETVEDSNPYLQTEDTGRNREQFGEGTVAREFVEGVGSGLIGIGEGVVGLGALGVDLVAGTDYADNVTETAEYLRDVAGFDPEGIVGKGAEVITQFVVPGVGVAGKVGKGFMKARQLAGKTGKLSKTERTNLALRELGAVAGVEMAVSGDNSTTIGDWVEMGPTQTTDLIGLEGTEKNLARVGNRLKVMAEAGAIGGALQAGLSKAGKTIGDAKVTKDIAGATKRKIDAAGTYLDELVDKRTLNAPGDDLSGLEKGIAEAVIFTRYRGATPAQIAEKRLLLDGQIKPELDKAGRIFNSIEADLDKIIKSTPSGSTLDKTDTLNKVLDYMRISDPAAKKTAFNSLPREIRKDAAEMRDHVDTLSQGVLDSKFLNDNNFMTKDGRMIKDVIQDGLGSYVRRRYKIFEDAKYTPDEKTIKVADNYFRKNKRLIGKELTRLARADVDDVFNDQFLRSNGLDRTGTGDKQIITVLGQPSETVVKKAREGYLNRYSLKKNEKLKGGFVAKDRLDTGMFISREKIAPALRSLLGEVDDPRAAVLGTVADLAQFNAIDDYFGSIAKMAETNTGIGKFFRNGKDLSEAQKKELTRRGYVKLGGDDGAASVLGSAGKNADAEKLIGRTGWGSLDGHYVPKQIYKDLTNQVAGESNWGVEMLKGGLGVALKAKGLSQYSKTVLSPVTQVRNFTTAVMFATANGNMPVLGRGSNFKDSATAVFSDIFNKGSEAVFDDLADAQRRGILGTNAELREIQDQLSKGIGYSNSAEVRPRNFIEAVRGKTTDNKYAQGVGKVAAGFEKAYQGSDDLWKYFSYHSEQAKLRHALDGASEADKIKYLTKNMDDVTIESQQAIRNGTANMDELIKTRAAQIVRDTVPNYNKGASEFIKLGRKLPFGNFITFPAEMYRTSFNIVRQSLDDMASDIPAIQARGRQRMIGFATTTAVVPAAALEMAYAVTDVTREEMEAFKRSFGAPWMKGATLIPTGRTEDGKIKYINYSTSNPYDVLSRFANRALTEADAAMEEGKDLDQWIVDVGIGTLGEAFAPFLDEAMLTDALLDISYRGGRTSTGAQVYNPEDNGATKLFKMSAHVANTMIPNVLAVADISGGKIEASRGVRGLLGDGLGIDAISSQDKMGRQRTWKKELARLSTGVSEQEFDPKQGLRFAAYGFQRGQTDSKRMFNSLTDDFGVTPAQLLKGYQDANEAKYRNDRGYYRMIQDLRTMGISDSEIRRTLKENNIGGIKGIMRGEFEPFKITPDTYKKLLRVDALDSLPRDAIQNVQDNMRNLPLDPQVKDRREIKPVEITPSAPQSNPYLQAPSNPAPANPYLNLDQGSLLPQSPIRQASNRGPVSPELLGGNPEERAANAFLNNRG